MKQKKIYATPTQRDASNPRHSVWVTANAGSGKTHVLIERVVRLLLSGAEPSSILCITYTKAAAAEMSERLFAKLGAWTALNDEALSQELRLLSGDLIDPKRLLVARRLFTQALETPGGLKIQTIHAFCEKLLHLFPVEAGLAPGFRVLDDRRERELRDEAIEHILQWAGSNNNSEYEKALADVVSHTNSEGFESLLREFLSGAKGLRSILNSTIKANDFALVLKKALNLDGEHNSLSLKAELQNVNRALYEHHAWFLSTQKPFYGFDAAKLMLQATKTQEPYEFLYALTFTKGRVIRNRKLYSSEFQKTYPQSALFLDSEKQRCADLIQRLDLHLRVEATSSLFLLAQAVQKEIEKKKRQLGFYDFDDLISYTAKLLNTSRTAQWVLYKLDAGLKHILVDEAQDTSPAQWQIIRALTDEFFAGSARPQNDKRTIFGVGDRKQSIYSFQGADAAAFNQARTYFEKTITDADQELKKIDLSISYRSTQDIFDAVDKVFPPETPLRLGFSPDDLSEKPHQTSRLNQSGVVEVWPLYETLEQQEQKPWMVPVDRESSDSPRRRLAKDIAMTIKSWIGRRIIAATDQPVKPDDILILLQSRGPIFSMLIAELRKANVPVAGADRLNLLESLAIQDLLALAKWLLLPQDDYLLACILKSPLMPMPLTEDQLFELAYGRGSTSLWHRVLTQDDENSKLLRQWETLVTGVGPFEFFSRVLLRSRKAMVARLGAEVPDATDALLDQALAYEQEHGPSLAGFVNWFTASESSLKREMEKGAGQVRLMTVHGAKGLEAKIVFLPDATSIAGGNNTGAKLLHVPNGTIGAGLPLWKLGNLTTAPIQEAWEENEHIKRQSERNRLLYVAMTRACDELYICGWKTERNISDECWYRTIENALGPRDENDQIRFGAPYTFREYQSEVSPKERFSEEWLTEIPVHELNTRIHSLTGLMAKHGPEARNYNPDSARRGIAIHTLLQELPDIAAHKRESFAARKAKRIGLDETEATALAQLINKPELAPFFGSESNGEAELRGRLSDGRMISGRVDRIAILPTKILLLDYKSDRHALETIDFSHPYVQQLSLYVEILKNAYPDHTIEAALLWTQTGRLEWISEGQLTQARDQALAELEAEAP